MISRRGFIKGSLALLATVNLPTKTLDSILNSTSEETKIQIISFAEINQILKDIYMPAIIDTLFVHPTTYEHYRRAVT